MIYAACAVRVTIFNTGINSARFLILHSYTLLLKSPVLDLQSCTGLSSVIPSIPCPIGLYRIHEDCTVLQQDRTVSGISLHSPTLTSKIQCPVLSHSPMGWTGLSLGFSHMLHSTVHRPDLWRAMLFAEPDGSIKYHRQISLLKGRMTFFC